MDIKNRLINIADRHPGFRNLWQKKENDLKIGRGDFTADNIHFRHNSVLLDGAEQKIFVDPDGYCRDSRILLKGEGNILHIGGNCVLSEHTSIAVRGKRNRIVIEQGCRIRNCSIFITGNDNTVLFRGDNTAFGLDIHMEEDGNLADIGIASTFHGRDGHHIEMAFDESTTIRIDPDCMLSSGIRIRSSDSHSIVNMEGIRLNHAEDIIVGEHCWIGLDAIILKGVRIPAHCIVGAGAVVTRPFTQDHCIIAGNPAVIVSEGVDWDRKFV